MRGDRDNSGDRDNKADLLSAQLDALEADIRREMEDPRYARTWPRALDLAQALEAVATAREELARCPEGARLALAAMNVHLYRLRSPALYAQGRYQGSVKGFKAPRHTRAGERYAERNAAIRARAAKLNPELSDQRKAEILAGADDELTARSIRRIIAK